MNATQSSSFTQTTESSSDFADGGFDFSFPDFVTDKLVDPVATGEENNIGIKPGWDNHSTEVTWADMKLFSGKVIVEEWKEFDGLASTVREHVNELPQNLAERQEADRNFDFHRKFLNKYGPWTETQVAGHILAYAEGISALLMALNRDRGDITVVNGWGVATERFEDCDTGNLTFKIENRTEFKADLALTDETRREEAMKLHFPIAALEMKGPRHPITTQELHAVAHMGKGFTEEGLNEAREFAKFLQKYLDEKQDWNGVGRCHAQAIVESMLSYTGYSVLYCTTWARGMYARFQNLNGTSVLKVKVSRAYKCDEKLSATLCVTTVFNEALGLITGKLREMRRENLDLLVNMGRACVLIGTGEVIDVNEGTGGENNAESSVQAAATGAVSTASWSFRSKSCGQAAHEIIPRWSKRWVEELFELATDRAIPLFWNDGEGGRKGILNDILHHCREMDDDEGILLAYNASIGVLGEGRCGMVKPTTLNGLASVIKFWNESEPEHRPLLLNEMAMFCYLASEHPFLMGTAVPRLLSVGMHHWIGPALVLERVGEHLNFDHGHAYLGDRELSFEEVTHIESAAMRNLTMLHRAGCMHGDIGFPNLLVAKVPRPGAEDGIDVDCGLDCQYYWQVWFIDLGLSRLQSDQRKLEAERESCEKLFGAYYLWTSFRQAQGTRRTPRISPRKGNNNDQTMRTEVSIF